MKIGIVDYGLGNVTSVSGALQRLSAESVVSSDPEVLKDCEKLILPGVGAFGDGMARLKGLGLVEALDELVRRDGRPLLGICLGAQLLTRHSDEFGHHEGFGWVPAFVEQLNPQSGDLRVPHVGWNDLFLVDRNEPIVSEIDDDALFYYVHSHKILAEDRSIVLGECEYGERFVALYRHGNIYGAQFHPEKSQRLGLTLLDNFLRQV